MIPVLPEDHGLPGVRAALDEQQMTELLRLSLPDCASGALLLEACRPQYVRYKPGTSCRVLYQLALRDAETGQRIETLAHAMLYADGGARTLWCRRSLGHLVARAARRHPGAPTERAAYLPQIGAVVQLYPVDSRLPALVRAASRSKMRRLLGEEVRGTPELIRYKPGRKALLRYELRHGALYGKLQTDDRGAALFSIGHALATAGVVTPVPVTYLPDLRMLVHPEARGAPLAVLRGTAEYNGWMGPVAEALAHLHTTGVRLHRPAVREADSVLAAARSVGQLVPQIAESVRELATKIITALDTANATQGVVHGDFYDDQALVGADGVVLLDFDEVCSGAVLQDVGNYLAHLTAGNGGEQLDGIRAAFLHAYTALRPVPEERVLAWEAAALLKLASGPFRRLEPRWDEGMERLVRLAGQRLQESGIWRAPVVLAAVDPMLPQVADLLDMDAISARLESEVYKEPVAVIGVEVVRHKPGRRCILRYDVEVGASANARRERLYGKTFASARGPQVYETISSITANRACGAQVRVPEPVAYLPDLKLLLQREAPGQPVVHALLQGDDRPAQHIAASLSALHTSGLELRRRHDSTKELRTLAERVERLAATCPDLAPLARRCLTAVHDAEPGTMRWRWRPVHRDFYHDQLLWDGQRLAVLDFDDAAMSEPAVDVANFTAHLTLLSAQQPEAAPCLAVVADAFAACYRAHDVDLDRNLLRVLEGATLLRLSEIHLLRNGGEQLAARLLHEASFLLDVRVDLVQR